MIQVQDVLIKPLNTEKTVAAAGKFTFFVHPKATKPEIAQAVKEFYKVDVDKVNVVNIGGKSRLVGRGKTMTKRSPSRKAIVTLKDGKKLNFNDFK